MTDQSKVETAKLTSEQMKVERITSDILTELNKARISATVKYGEKTNTLQIALSASEAENEFGADAINVFSHHGVLVDSIGVTDRGKTVVVNFIIKA